jgi:hypothetical protein
MKRSSKLFSVVAALALLTGPAAAQMMNLMPEVKSKSAEEKEQDAITEKAYRESLRKIPDTNSRAKRPIHGAMCAAMRRRRLHPRNSRRTKTGSAAN